MKKFKLSGLAHVLLLASVAVPIASPAAQSRTPVQHARESIVFARSVYDMTNPRMPDFGTGLFRIDPKNRHVVQVTPLELNSYNRIGSWSPNGISLVYEHATRDRPDRSQLFVVDRQGASHRITSGAALHGSAVWGPKADIAFVTDFGDRKCLSMVRADGTRQRLLFCPTAAERISRPQWSQDGRRIYLLSTRSTSDGGARSNIWSVKVATGMATRLFTLDSYWSPFMAMAPDGKRAILTGSNASGTALLVNLTTGTTLSLDDVPQAVFSHDGRRIAFSRDGKVWVMKADGSHQHRVTDVDGPRSFNVRAWSKDDCHILFDPYLEQYDENGTYVGNHVWIVDATTHLITRLTQGEPTTTSWYEP
jgi:Tol biopolymer transport system component